jgi:hypothetical protein
MNKQIKKKKIMFFIVFLLFLFFLFNKNFILNRSIFLSRIQKTESANIFEKKIGKISEIKKDSDEVKIQITEEDLKEKQSYIYDLSNEYLKINNKKITKMEQIFKKYYKSICDDTSINKIKNKLLEYESQILKKEIELSNIRIQKNFDYEKYSVLKNKLDAFNIKIQKQRKEILIKKKELLYFEQYNFKNHNILNLREKLNELIYKKEGILLDFLQKQNKLENIEEKIIMNEKEINFLLKAKENIYSFIIVLLENKKEKILEFEYFLNDYFKQIYEVLK